MRSGTLVINRLLDIWVLESKHYAEGVAINDHGEWTAFRSHREVGIASPVEQNRRHTAVLEDVFANGLMELPRRLGMTIRPRIRGLVLVSNGARIVRPRSKAAQARVDGLDTVLKAEQLFTTIERDLDQRRAAAFAKLVSSETIERLGSGLVALHRPATLDWASWFGLSSEAPPIAHAAATRVEIMPEQPAPPGTCAKCGRAVSRAVIDYCRVHSKRFEGRVLCYECQRGRIATDPKPIA